MRALIFASLLSIALHPQSYADSPPSSNQRLQQLFLDDQKARTAGKVDWEKLAEEDKLRRAEVLRIIAETGLNSADDYYHAAMVFQHGESADEIRTAFSLAWMAATLDPENESARWLAAAAWDRIMMRENMPQWYGTQFYKPSLNSPWELYKVDESAVNDEERTRMGVRPLEESRRLAAKMNK